MGNRDGYVWAAQEDARLLNLYTEHGKLVSACAEALQRTELAIRY